MKLAKLEKVNLRDIWKHEQYDFSDWLSKDENIQLLSETIGLTLTDIKKEVVVGAYRCDLVAKIEESDRTAIIENQLETTNHDHLGKIITYASGLDADIIIWIVEKAKEEHRSAIEWLNNNTINDIFFFLIEIQVYKIGDSLPAPKFEIIEMPNDFSKPKNEKIDVDTMNETEKRRFNFWKEFNNLVVSKDKPFNINRVQTRNCYRISTGISRALVLIRLQEQKNSIAIEFYIQNDKDLFDQLFSCSQEIQKELGFSMDWRRQDKGKDSKIVSL